MGMFDTTARIESDRMLEDAQKGIQSLQKWLTEMNKAIKDQRANMPGRAFPINWGDVMMKKALGIYNEIARCNGAVLVRATEPAKDETAGTNLVTCEPNGSRCNLCGGMIPDGDFICTGGHEIGTKYPVPI